jgi:hypothetical protein
MEGGLLVRNALSRTFFLVVVGIGGNRRLV